MDTLFPNSLFSLFLFRRQAGRGGRCLFPFASYAFSRWAVRQVNREEQRPAIIYFHPWEVDPEQPRVLDAPLKSKVRHYSRLSAMAGKLRRLMGDFQWGRVDEVLKGQQIRTVSRGDRKSTSLNSSNYCASRMPSSACKKKNKYDNDLHHLLARR